jgi:hypothetical protein
MSSILTITPGQTSQMEIEHMLGVADGTEEPLLTEWTWVYLCKRGSETMLFITFDTTSTPFVVAKMKYLSPQIAVADLINLFGLPELVYKESNNNQSEESTEYTFAYPSIGVFGFAALTSPPVVSGDIDGILIEIPQDLQYFITNLGNQKDVEIIEWSSK